MSCSSPPHTTGHLHQLGNMIVRSGLELFIPTQSIWDSMIAPSDQNQNKNTPSEIFGFLPQRNLNIYRQLCVRMIVPCNPVSAAPGLSPDIWCGRGLASTRHPSYRRSRHTAAQYYKWVLTSTCNFHHLLHLRHDDAGHHRSNFSIPQMFLCSNLRFHGISYTALARLAA